MNYGTIGVTPVNSGKDVRRRGMEIGCHGTSSALACDIFRWKNPSTTPVPVKNMEEGKERTRTWKKKSGKKKTEPFAVEERLSEVRTTRLRCWKRSSG
jgi:hypothetical protein